MNKGFIALTITLSIAGTLLALVAASSISSAVFFDMALRKEYRFMNYYYAGDCVDQAIVSLAQDFFLTITTPREIPYLHCSILSIERKGEMRTITARGDYQKAYVYRHAEVVVRNHDLEVAKNE